MNNDELLFDFIPHELILQFLSYLNPSNIFTFQSLYPKLFESNQLLNIIRNKTSEQTGLRTNNLTLDKLKELSKFRFNRNICAGGDHSIIIKRDGSVYGFGYNRDGQLALNDYIDRYEPTLIPINNIVQVAVNSGQSLFLSSNGSVYGSGWNIHNVLGLDIENVCIPTIIPNLNNIVSISVGDSFSLVLTSEGTVYQLGGINRYGKPVDVSNGKYQLVSGLIDIISVSAGYNHSLALTSSGHVYAFGWNEDGQLGIDTFNKYIDIPVLIPELENVVQIATGECYSLALTSEMKVYSWGYNNSGQLGRKRSISPEYIPQCIMDNIVSISTMSNHSLLLTESGQIYSFGYGDCCLLGRALNNDSPQLIHELKDIVQISAGISHSLVLDIQGNIYGFGDDDCGQLGARCENLGFNMIPNFQI